ncbi:hypothetical protein ACJMK2_011694 [Sinanodonta woodiana]|uniref:LRAT domain-containing protein n=1 Tax=Sinanodonta woodiana TaxID=1069815 RepID=A0ABD3V8X0_SINWO
MKTGDQIAVPFSTKMAKLYHFGIYIGPMEGVAHFGENYLEIVDLFAFKGDSTLFRAVYQPDICLADEVVATTAKNLVTNPECWGPYHLIDNNCEHFATYCKTGKAFSLQVKDKKMGEKMVKIVQFSYNSYGSSSKSSASRSRGSFPSS